MDVVTLGETMVLFTAEATGYMRYANQFSAKVAGAESNVAIGLARLGHETGWISKLGQDEFGMKIISFIRGEGVDVSKVLNDSKASTGLYFKERLTEEEVAVQYYRTGSAASRMTAKDLSEAYISKAKFLHISGITPALSQSCYETVLRAIEIAKMNGVQVVFDPNLRRKLWVEDKARKTLMDIAKRSDIILPGIDEGAFLLGEDEPKAMAEKFHELGPSCVVIKLGDQGAYYLSEKEQGTVPAYPVSRVVDPVGAGDGFAAGLLSGLLDQLPLQTAVKRGAAVGALVTMVKGDVEGLPDRERLNAFVNTSKPLDVNR